MQSESTNGQDVRQHAEETASTLVDQARDVAQTQATTQKDRAAETIDVVAQSLREAGSSMRDQQPQIASLADQAARRVEGVSGYLRQHDVRDLVGEAESFARREPLIFLGGAFAVGFLAARFLKASSPSGGGYGSSARGGYGYAAGGGYGGDYSYGSQRRYGDQASYGIAASYDQGGAGQTGYGGDYGRSPQVESAGLGVATPAWSATELGTESRETDYAGAAYSGSETDYESGATTGMSGIGSETGDEYDGRNTER